MVMVTSLVTTSVIARFLSPGEVGISVLGSSVFAIAEAVRELGSPAYIVQQDQLTSAKIRTIFTVHLLTTAVVAALALLAAAPLAGFYGVPGLSRYIQVMVLGYVTGPVVYPIIALMSREMAFHRIALIDTTTSVVGAGVSILLAVAGFGSLSLAWAAVASSAVAVFLACWFCRDFDIFRPSLSAWRGVLGFGIYGSMTAVLYRTLEALLYLIIGKLLDSRAVGLLQRALLLAYFPERVILAGVGAVALPTFSDHSRQGKDLKTSYLNAIEYVAAVEWAALLFLIVLADPIIRIVLGPQWHDVVPLVRIIGAALLVKFPLPLAYPLQVAAGGIRHTAPLALAQVALALGALTFAAGYGLYAVALSIVFVAPINVALALMVLRIHVQFRWRDFVLALRKSAVAAGLCAVGLLSVLSANGWHSDLSDGATILAAGLGGAGWVAGLLLTRHPLAQELRQVSFGRLPWADGSASISSARVEPGVVPNRQKKNSRVA